MDIAKVIRIIGYVAYLCIWLPVLIVVTPIMFIACLVYWMGQGAVSAVVSFGDMLLHGIKHDMEFIRTGEWK